MVTKLATVGFLALTMTGCYVRARAVTPSVHVRASTPGVVVEDYDSYEPEYIDDNIVYYDDSGMPYYYVDNRVVYIAPTHPRYALYLNHYRTHRDVYLRWRGRYGTQRLYRRGQWRVRVR